MSRDWQGKRYWLVGASDGLGAALAHVMSRAGAHVILSARREEKLREVADALPGPATVQECDVSDPDSVKQAVEAIGEIDGIVYLAGLYWPQPAQEWTQDEILAMADVNFVGALRCVGAVMPAMIERDRGHIVITGSLSGFRGLPGAQGYAASKAGVMAFAESLYADLRKTGVTVQLGNPGFIKTRLTDKNDFKMPFLMTPEEAADHMFALMESDRFEKHFPMVFSWVFRLSRFLPDWAYYRLFS
ncbi:SDR family NAD(P)-dependent oxidoreductase [Pseudaestuariivita atlantica]|uniref:Short-chain dehydrogenase n=1 Tax=Pseudaestuariivita atlantica TaxID=1317121 RepID=A0A0L1JSL7_9RHOB|nr:SDR family NAD(P)-dependent oxidoreductase [Pseudaestuariivita atlantica]KNG94736.1 short-chain dehydrogenase [Pseudaestuariivita atlantica]